MRIPISLLKVVRHPAFRVSSVVLLAGGIMILLFRHLGSWLLVADPLPQQLDAVCTFAGENVRVDYSRKLMNDFPGAVWYLSDHQKGQQRVLQKNKFDMSRVFAVDTCKSTFSEIQSFAGWIAALRKAQDTKGNAAILKIGLVSSPYHMRRISIMARRWIKTERVTLYYLPVPFDGYPWNKETLRHWWRSEVGVTLTTTELLKLGYFMLTGYF